MFQFGIQLICETPYNIVYYIEMDNIEILKQGIQKTFTDGQHCNSVTKS